jgi:hypothetical protein
LIVENATQFLNVFHWSSSSQSSSKVGAYLAVPQLQDLIPCFLSQQSNPDRDLPLIRIPLTLCPNFNGRIHVLPSATSLYYAPSDKSSIRRMYQERIRAVKSWRKCPARNDCAFVEYNADEPELSFQVLNSHDQVVLSIYDGSKWLRLSKVKIASATAYKAKYRAHLKRLVDFEKKTHETDIIPRLLRHMLKAARYVLCICFTEP